MKLSDRYQYIILCEDSQMDTFIRSFLKCSDINSHKIRTIPIPLGKGCGEQHVRQNIPNEIAILHRYNYKKIALIVCIDADYFSYEERKKGLIESVKSSDSSWNIENDMVLIWIPKREIETWISYFKGENPDEENSYRHNGKPISCKTEAKKMFLYCQGVNEESKNALPSLIKAKDEYEKICRLQGVH